MRNTTWGSLRWLPIGMQRRLASVLAVASAAASLPAVVLAQSQEPHLHVNTRWDECSFQINSSLTKAAWRQFTGEAGVVTYFKPLVSAEPMGAGKFEISVLQWKTGIDDHDAAWNDTFVHPDSTHWLFEGSGLEFPGLTARAGISDRTDVGVYFTQNPGANYGFYGAQLQRNLVQTGNGWSASGRVSFVSMFGPEDLDFRVYGVDLVASRRYSGLSRRASVSPYAIVSTSLSHAHEKTAVVSLEDQAVLGAHATVGAVAQFSVARVAVEYSVARVPSVSMKIGIGPGSN
jgi:hypothetical protein